MSWLVDVGFVEQCATDRFLPSAARRGPPGLRASVLFPGRTTVMGDLPGGASAGPVARRCLVNLCGWGRLPEVVGLMPV
jgi:hypothetical protein